MIALAYLGLWIFVFSLPWEGVVVIPGVGVVPRLAGMIASGLTLMAVVAYGRVRRLHPFHVAALLFVGLAGVHLLVFFPQEKLPAKFWTYVQLLLMTWMVWELARTPRKQLGLLLAYVLGAYVAAVGTILVYRRAAGEMFRYSAGGIDANDLAMLMALGLPMAWYLGLVHRNYLVRWICRGYIPVALVALGLTGSRGGMIASIVGLSIIPLTLTRLSPAKLFAGILVLIVSAWLAVTFTPDTLVERFASTTTEVEDARFGGRFKLWRAGLQVFVERPFLGWGTSSFKPAITPLLGPMAQVAHNAFISVLVEQGLIGLLLFLTMFVTVFRSILPLPPLEKRFALVLFATLVISMLPLTWEARKSAWFVFAALLTMSRVGDGMAAAVPRAGVPRARPLAARAPGGGAPLTARHRTSPPPWRHEP